MTNGFRFSPLLLQQKGQKKKKDNKKEEIELTAMSAGSPQYTVRSQKKRPAAAAATAPDGGTTSSPVAHQVLAKARRQRWKEATAPLTADDYQRALHGGGNNNNKSGNDNNSGGGDDGHTTPLRGDTVSADADGASPSIAVATWMVGSSSTGTHHRNSSSKSTTRTSRTAGVDTATETVASEYHHSHRHGQESHPREEEAGEPCVVLLDASVHGPLRELSPRAQRHRMIVDDQNHYFRVITPPELAADDAIDDGVVVVDFCSAGCDCEERSGGCHHHCFSPSSMSPPPRDRNDGELREERVRGLAHSPKTILIDLGIQQQQQQQTTKAQLCEDDMEGSHHARQGTPTSSPPQHASSSPASARASPTTYTTVVPWGVSNVNNNNGGSGSGANSPGSLQTPPQSSAFRRRRGDENNSSNGGSSAEDDLPIPNFSTSHGTPQMTSPSLRAAGNAAASPTHSVMGGQADESCSDVPQSSSPTFTSENMVINTTGDGASFTSVGLMGSISSINDLGMVRKHGGGGGGGEKGSSDISQWSPEFLSPVEAPPALVLQPGTPYRPSQQHELQVSTNRISSPPNTGSLANTPLELMSIIGSPTSATVSSTAPMANGNTAGRKQTLAFEQEDDSDTSSAAAAALGLLGNISNNHNNRRAATSISPPQPLVGYALSGSSSPVLLTTGAAAAAAQGGAKAFSIPTAPSPEWQRSSVSACSSLYQENEPQDETNRSAAAQEAAAAEEAAVLGSHGDDRAAALNNGDDNSIRSSPPRRPLPPTTMMNASPPKSQTILPEVRTPSRPLPTASDTSAIIAQQQSIHEAVKSMIDKRANSNPAMTSSPQASSGSPLSRPIPVVLRPPTSSSLGRSEEEALQKTPPRPSSPSPAPANPMDEVTGGNTNSNAATPPRVSRPLPPQTQVPSPQQDNTVVRIDGERPASLGRPLPPPPPPTATMPRSSSLHANEDKSPSSALPLVRRSRPLPSVEPISDSDEAIKSKPPATLPAAPSPTTLNSASPPSTTGRQQRDGGNKDTIVVNTDQKPLISSSPKNDNGGAAASPSAPPPVVDASNNRNLVRRAKVVNVFVGLQEYTAAAESYLTALKLARNKVPPRANDVVRDVLAFATSFSKASHELIEAAASSRQLLAASKQLRDAAGEGNEQIYLRLLGLVGEELTAVVRQTNDAARELHDVRMMLHVVQNTIPWQVLLFPLRSGGQQVTSLFSSSDLKNLLNTVLRHWKADLSRVLDELVAECRAAEVMVALLCDLQQIYPVAFLEVSTAYRLIQQIVHHICQQNASELERGSSFASLNTIEHALRTAAAQSQQDSDPNSDSESSSNKVVDAAVKAVTETCWHLRDELNDYDEGASNVLTSSSSAVDGGRRILTTAPLVSRTPLARRFPFVVLATSQVHLQPGRSVEAELVQQCADSHRYCSQSQENLVAVASDSSQRYRSLLEIALEATSTLMKHIDQYTVTVERHGELVYASIAFSRYLDEHADRVFSAFCEKIGSSTTNSGASSAAENVLTTAMIASGVIPQSLIATLESTQEQLSAKHNTLHVFVAKRRRMHRLLQEEIELTRSLDQIPLSMDPQLLLSHGTSGLDAQHPDPIHSVEERTRIVSQTMKTNETVSRANFLLLGNCLLQQQPQQQQQQQATSAPQLSCLDALSHLHDAQEVVAASLRRLRLLAASSMVAAPLSGAVSAAASAASASSREVSSFPRANNNDNNKVFLFGPSGPGLRQEQASRILSKMRSLQSAGVIVFLADGVRRNNKKTTEGAASSVALAYETVRGTMRLSADCKQLYIQSLRPAAAAAGPDDETTLPLEHLNNGDDDNLFEPVEPIVFADVELMLQGPSVPFGPATHQSMRLLLSKPLLSAKGGGGGTGMERSVMFPSFASFMEWSEVLQLLHRCTSLLPSMELTRLLHSNV